MKAKYEISVWSDIFDNDLGRFKEQKEIIIGSDTMTSDARARNPKLVNNINGTNQFTFDMYYRYIDNQTGEEIENPYIKYLINERKIKVLWKDEWYDLLIKQVKEDQAGRVFSYTCEDCYVTELSRTGFELTFSTQLSNNIGTAEELVEKVIEGTDWRYDKKGSDSIYQLTEEPVYLIDQARGNSFIATDCLSGDPITIKENLPILLYYSQALNLKDIQDKIDNNKAQQDIQFFYTGTDQTGFQQAENDMLVTNGQCCNKIIKWKIDGHAAIAQEDGITLFRLNFDEGISKEYRAERCVQSQRSVYSDILERYVNVYNYTDESGVTREIYGYNTTEYNDALAVVNLVTNPSNFKNANGWKRENKNDILYQKLSPPFDETTKASSYTATSYLYIPKGITFNNGIANNKAYLQDGFSAGEEYVFRIKMLSALMPNEYVKSYGSLQFSIMGRDPTHYEPNEEKYFEITKIDYNETTHWNEYILKCIKSCSYDDLDSSSAPFGMFLTTDNNYWLEEMQFYRKVEGINSNNEKVRIDPGSLSIQSVAQQYWKYFDADQPEGTTKDNLEPLYVSLDEWSQAKPQYNDYQKYGTIEEDNSNRFNILQSIAEKFECWVRFVIQHDDNGYIQFNYAKAPNVNKDNFSQDKYYIYNNGQYELVTYYDETLEYYRLLPCKYIQLKTELGQETGVGFIYGIDLKDITRNIKSDKISTKTIVEQNENEFGKNGFCTIARSKLNYARENFIYNFDYYIQHGLLDKVTVYNDLYYVDGYYSKLYINNINYAKNLEERTNKNLELTKQTAMLTVYKQYKKAAEDELNSITENLIKLAGTENFATPEQCLAQAEAYADAHRNDIKVQALIGDRNIQNEELQIYTNLYTQLNDSVNTLTKRIEELDKAQDTIINNLRELNHQFYIKYSRFIQEGTWTSEDYWDDDLYYLDALQIAYESSRPQISYDINVLRLSDIEEYSSKQYHLGDISFIQDVKYFGYQDDGITPYKEKVVLTEITSYFDTPDKDVIKVQNYKNQFDDLFQRITASVQNLEFSEGKYAKAANIMADDGTIRSSVIQNTFNENKDLIYGAQNESATIDNTGITVVDNGNAAKQVKITSGGIFVTADGGETWKNAIRGDGISTELLTAGKINTENITVYNGNHPSFRWDSTGLNAYSFIEDATQPELGSVDTTQFVRVDQYGLYGMQDAEPVFVPASEKDVYDKANFGLTWNRFFLKNKKGTTNSVEISTNRDIVLSQNNQERIIIGRINGQNDSPERQDEYGMRITNAQNQVVFECGYVYDEIIKGYKNRTSIAGWEFDNTSFQSSRVENDQYIKLEANGTIGCYTSATKDKEESVYSCTIAPGRTIIPLDINTGKAASVEIKENETIYPFVSSVGALKTQRARSSDKEGKTNDAWAKCENDQASFLIYPVLSTEIEFDYQGKTYALNDIHWDNITKTGVSVSAKSRTVSGNNTTHKEWVNTYTWSFSATAKNVSNQKLFTIQTIATTKHTRQVPASQTIWSINNQGKAIFHDIIADGGKIAGWWIDSAGIYQTKDGTQKRFKDDGKSNIRTELSANGTAGDINYSILTDAIKAAMATLGGVLLSNGLVNGYDIAEIASKANYALSLANTALSKTKNLDTKYAKKGHKHGFSGSGAVTSGPCRYDSVSVSGTTDAES